MRAPDPPIICTHERGPGTAMCLRCRRDARIAAGRRNRRTLMRVAAGGIVLAVVAGAVIGTVRAIRQSTSNRPAPRDTVWYALGAGQLDRLSPPPRMRYPRALR